MHTVSYTHPNIKIDIRKRFVLHSGVILWNNLNTLQYSNLID